MNAWKLTWMLLFAGPLLGACDVGPAAPGGEEAASASRGLGQQTMSVSGSTVAFASTGVVHSEVPTETGVIQRSTSVARLTGDLDGWLLFQPTSVFDFESGSLVNTGTQIFAGTILGSDPVILHDDKFRFDIDLGTGETIGDVRLSRSNDAPNKGGWFECRLEVVGTGVTPEGDPTSDYTGECIRRGNLISLGPGSA